MPNLIRTMFLQSTGLMYRLLRPVIFLRPAQQSHENMRHVLRYLDANPAAQFTLEAVNRAAFSRWPIQIGGVMLPHPFILGAGFVGGQGFNDEAEALGAAQTGVNLLPGWRTMPTLVGPVEYGSFTRWPRRGNFGTVVWRDAPTQSSQHRLGLKNPGATAAAHFLSLSKIKAHLPKTYGINIAPMPEVQDTNQHKQEITECVEAFLSREVYPSWFTLNIDRPLMNEQADTHTVGTVCEALVAHLRQRAGQIGREIPLWVKINPGLTQAQYQAMLCVFEQTGVRAVIATNSAPQPAPGYINLMADTSGGKLHTQATEVVQTLSAEKKDKGYKLDIIGSGGVQDPVSYRAFNRHDVIVVQYWTIIIYRGPLAAARILNDINDVLQEKYKDT